MVSVLINLRALAFLAVLMAVLAGMGSPVLAESVGVIKSVQGEVKIRRAAEERIASVGDELTRLDVISTGTNSSCGVILDDGTTVSVGAQAAFEIAEYTFEPSNGTFDLVLRALFGRLVYGSGRIGEARPDRVRIETPFLSIGTRGTRFAVLLPSAPQ